MSAGLTLTKGESLFIWRRRQAISQIAAAGEFGVHVDVYRDWETDRRTHDQPRKMLGKLKLTEHCVILRRRQGLTQDQLAAAMACTRLWVIQMERAAAPVDRLRDFWRL